MYNSFPLNWDSKNVISPTFKGIFAVVKRFIYIKKKKKRGPVCRY